MTSVTGICKANKNLILLAQLLLLLLAFTNTGCSDKDSADDPIAAHTGNFEEEPESPQLVDCDVGQPDCRKVVDCSDGEKCVSRGVTFDVDACAETEETQKCKNFQERLQHVTLISDAYNFVTSPFTEETLSAEYIASLARPWSLAFLPGFAALFVEPRTAESREPP